MPIPITGLYAGVLGLLLFVLSLRVILSVRFKGTGFGDGGNPEHTVVVRGQANFCEYVPFVLILFGILELQGTPAALLHGLGIGLVASRLLHPAGLTTAPGVNPLRFVGTAGTFLVLFVSSTLAILGSVGMGP